MTKEELELAIDRAAAAMANPVVRIKWSKSVDPLGQRVNGIQYGHGKPANSRNQDASDTIKEGQGSAS